MVKQQHSDVSASLHYLEEHKHCRQWMDRGGHDFDAMWGATRDVIVKSLLAVQPGLAHNYRTVLPPGHGSSSCFELLGESSQ